MGIWDAEMWVTEIETLQELLSPLFLFPQYQNISPQVLQFLMTQKQEQGCHR